MSGALSAPLLMSAAGFLMGARTVVCTAGSAKYFLGSSPVCVSTLLGHPWYSPLGSGEPPRACLFNRQSCVSRTDGANCSKGSFPLDWILRRGAHPLQSSRVMFDIFRLVAPDKIEIWQRPLAVFSVSSLPQMAQDTQRS